jgi:hypothetical protein
MEVKVTEMQLCIFESAAEKLIATPFPTWLYLKNS